MVIFTKSYLSGLGRDQSNLWENLFIQWIENNWTLTDPPKYHPVTAKHGVLFGLEYFGQWDYVASASIEDNEGISSNLMSLGGRHDSNSFDITFAFSVRKYSAQQGDELATQVTNVSNFIEDLIDENPRALQSEGIRYMTLTSIRDGELELYGQQIYQMRFVISCLVSRINLE